MSERHREPLKVLNMWRVRVGAHENAPLSQKEMKIYFHRFLRIIIAICPFLVYRESLSLFVHVWNG